MGEVLIWHGEEEGVPIIQRTVWFELFLERDGSGKEGDGGGGGERETFRETEIIERGAERQREREGGREIKIEGRENTRKKRKREGGMNEYIDGEKGISHREYGRRRMGKLN